MKKTFCKVKIQKKIPEKAELRYREHIVHKRLWPQKIEIKPSKHLHEVKD